MRKMKWEEKEEIGTEGGEKKRPLERARGPAETVCAGL